MSGDDEYSKRSREREFIKKNIIWWLAFFFILYLLNLVVGIVDGDIRSAQAFTNYFTDPLRSILNFTIGDLLENIFYFVVGLTFLIGFNYALYWVGRLVTKPMGGGVQEAVYAGVFIFMATLIVAFIYGKYFY